MRPVVYVVVFNAMFIDEKPTFFELQNRISIAVNTCKDVTTLGRFAASVDPVRWVEGLQALLEDGMDGEP